MRQQVDSLGDRLGLRPQLASVAQQVVVRIDEQQTRPIRNIITQRQDLLSSFACMRPEPVPQFLRATAEEPLPNPQFRYRDVRAVVVTTMLLVGSSVLAVHPAPDPKSQTEDIIAVSARSGADDAAVSPSRAN